MQIKHTTLPEDYFHHESEKHMGRHSKHLCFFVSLYSHFVEPYRCGKIFFRDVGSKIPKNMKHILFYGNIESGEAIFKS